MASGAQGAGLGFEHTPSPTHWPVPLVPSSLSPPAWPGHGQLPSSRELSCVLARTWPLVGRIWEQRPSGRRPWGTSLVGCRAILLLQSPPFVLSQEAWGPRSQDPKSIANKSQRPGKRTGEPGICPPFHHQPAQHGSRKLVSKTTSCSGPSADRALAWRVKCFWKSQMPTPRMSSWLKC